MTGWRLVADAGGTNVRFAQASGGALRNRQSYAVARHASFLEALMTYLDAAGGPAGCAGAAIGAAGPVEAGSVTLTNASWVIKEDEAARALGAPVMIVNDLEAVAHSLPHLAKDEVAPIGPPLPQRNKTARMLAVNVGTGFGAAAIIRSGSEWVACPSEAGHMTFAAADPVEYGLYGEVVSVEDVLSGRGVVRLYSHFQGTAGETAGQPSAAEIFEMAAIDPQAGRTAEVFTRLLARIAGDLALAVAAWDGVFFYGSVVAGWRPIADELVFRGVFENKGAMTARMRSIPTSMVLKEDAALFGLARLPLPSR